MESTSNWKIKAVSKLSSIFIEISKSLILNIALFLHTYRHLMEDTKLTLTKMISEKGHVSKQLNRPSFSIFGLKVPFLPALPIWWTDPSLENMLGTMDQEEDMTLKKMTDMEGTIKKQNLELAESREKIKGFNILWYFLALSEFGKMKLGKHFGFAKSYHYQFLVVAIFKHTNLSNAGSDRYCCQGNRRDKGGTTNSE